MKLLDCALVFSGMALVGLILSKAVNYLVEKQEALLVKALHLNEKLGPSEILKDIEIHWAKHKFLTVLFILALLIVSGIVFLFAVEERGFVDALLCLFDNHNSGLW